MIETPQIVQTTPVDAAMLHLTVPSAQMREVMGPSIKEVFSAIAAQGIQPVGPWFTHHHRRPTDTFDFEICVPVSSPITSAGRVTPGTWPAMQVARTIYTGPYEGLGGAWGEFHEWLDSNGHKTAEDLWERYLVNPDSNPDPSSWRTELNRPLVA